MHAVVIFGAAALLSLGLLAFWPTYLSKPFATADVYTHVHAGLGAAWLSLLLAQALLVQRGRRGIHRKLGYLSYAIAPLFVLSSVLLAHYRFSRMDGMAFATEAYTLYLPLSAASLFAIAYLRAIANRRSQQTHARFMACTGLVLVDPVLGRVLGFYVLELPEFWHYQFITFGVELIVLLLLVRTLPATASGAGSFRRFAAVYAATLVLWFATPESTVWLSFAQWFRTLQIT